MSKRVYQRSLPTVILSIVALVLVVEYFSAPYEPLMSLTDMLLRWGVIVSVCMTLFGFAIITLNHVRVLIRAERTRATYRSSVMMITLISFLIVGLGFPGDVSSAQFSALYAATVIAIMVALEGMGGLYQLWIPYRMLRFRSLEAALLITTFLLAVLWNTPHAAVTFPPFVTIGEWLGNVPHTAASRGAVLCAAVGATILGIRALLGREPGLIELEVEEK